MREILEISGRLEAGETADAPAAMATVVTTAGSVYRRSGARMFLYADGRRVGSVSGGCLEADVAERARRVTATGRPAYVLYDTRGEGGDTFFDLGCNGAVGVLIERAGEPEARRGLHFLARFHAARQSGVMATIYQVSGAIRAEPGQRLCLSESGGCETSITDFDLRDALLSDCRLLLEAPQIESRTYAFSQGSAEVLLEAVAPPVRLLVCGAGQDAIPLAQAASLLGWQTLIADHRPAFLTAERFPAASELLETRPEQLLEHIAPDARTVAVIMTHNFGHDRTCLQRLLPSAACYIGLLGPKRRAERMLRELHESGLTLEPGQLKRLYNPAGLDIGAETPEEIALAIVAEIQAHLAGRTGRPLRERGGPIHPERSPSEANLHSERNGEAVVCRLSE